jgi:hypothetical protein
MLAVVPLPGWTQLMFLSGVGRSSEAIDASSNILGGWGRRPKDNFALERDACWHFSV